MSCCHNNMLPKIHYENVSILIGVGNSPVNICLDSFIIIITIANHCGLFMSNGILISSKANRNYFIFTSIIQNK